MYLCPVPREDPLPWVVSRAGRSRVSHGGLPPLATAVPARRRSRIKAVDLASRESGVICKSGSEREAAADRVLKLR
jgi:hypothetical protein